MKWDRIPPPEPPNRRLRWGAETLQSKALQRMYHEMLLSWSSMTPEEQHRARARLEAVEATLDVLGGNP